MQSVVLIGMVPSLRVPIKFRSFPIASVHYLNTYGGVKCYFLRWALAVLPLAESATSWAQASEVAIPIRGHDSSIGAAHDVDALEVC